MSEAAQKAVYDAAMQAAARNLKHAATFAELYATAAPLFQKRMQRPGSAAVIVRFIWPGVLQVCDPKTGEVLAQSGPGNPQQLSYGFKPGGAAGYLKDNE
ncbi:MAG: hypothetical protein ABS39_05050 [Acidovorax sp. SCN 65-28]|uniref:hypothetical protein n=1 Tax=Acidovorax sp. TaxID=1872122 RepID=UPI0008691491|nr:hypothetical protein [Acidovorax sp.]MBN9627166.1 hypothetical protein [Acidovorax sp.]ODS78798.1 MAG: hypothetical protein ABS39_05050 [Acidovorax sp. SCN 65-28]OJT97661.1 MAG: hypothetical protein BGN90_05665 [Acidovorax sp. 65-7]